ncbi:MAG: radical SAM-associated putative lipoprotein [Bacteroidetes bacterium]|nr:radical SAM-associated putative lipoprotein [Bacteroidota bacterium]
MKIRFTKKTVLQFNSLLLLLIGLLGFSAACDKESPALYGTPSADFIINGVVKNKTNQPIPNIKVVALYDSINTDALGKFIIKNRTIPTDQAFNVKLIDIDGTANGSFLNKDTLIVFNDNTFKDGDGSWYSGKVERSVEIKLTSK